MKAPQPGHPPSTGKPRVERVEDWYADQVDYYERHRRHSRLQWITFETAAIVLTGSTPIIVAITTLPTALKAAPAALAAILTSLSLRSGLRDDHVRWTMTRMNLEYEHLRMEMRTPPYRPDASSDEVAAQFFERALAITEHELSDWYKAQHAAVTPPPNGDTPAT